MEKYTLDLKRSISAIEGYCPNCGEFTRFGECSKCGCNNIVLYEKKN